MKRVKRERIPELENALAGGALKSDGSGVVPGVFLYSFQSGAYQRVSEIGNTIRYGLLFWTSPQWLDDSRRLLFTHDSDIYLLDSVSTKTQPLRKSLSKSEALVATISNNNRSIFWTTVIVKSDIWLLTIQVNAWC